MHELLPILSQVHSAGLFAGVGAIYLICAIFLSVFWVWAMVDCLSSSMATGEKVMWFFIILFLHIIGAVVYFLVARGPHDRRIVT